MEAHTAAANSAVASEDETFKKPLLTLTDDTSENKTFKKPHPVVTLKTWDDLYGIFRIENCLRGTNKVVGTSDPLYLTPRPPVWQMYQVLLFIFFEGFPNDNEYVHNTSVSPVK